MSQSHASGTASGGTVFLFPGQGSYDAGTLHELYTAQAETAPFFAQADAAARRRLGEPFLPLVAPRSVAQRQAAAEAAPDLQQLGIFLAGVCIAHLLERRGVRPDLMAGHSFGALAALAAAGVFDVATGLEIVCERVLALRAAPTGAMAAVACGPARVEALLRGLERHALEIALLNHPQQTVVSGPRADLEAFAALLARQCVSLTFLASRYAFHSSHLAPVAERFGASLRRHAFGAARVPVYLAIEGRLYAPDVDLPALLSSQLVRRLDFAGAVRDMYRWGHRRFVEIGSGHVLGKLVLKNLAGAPGTASVGALDELARVVPADVSQASAPPVAPPAEACAQAPIAIVAMGCVVPGANDPDEFWRHVLEGTSGIVDLAQLEPALGRDFVAGRAGDAVEVVADKTYTLLNGAIRDVPYDAARIAAFYDEPAFAELTRGQKLLACALAQTVGGASALGAGGGGRTQCILGATADGSSEYDEALFLESARDALGEIDLQADRRREFGARLDDLPGLRARASEGLRQHEMYRSVVGRLLGDGVRTFVVDSACSSSLYSIALGVKALADREVDRVVAGGVFAPGPANNTLFAQFRGLTPHASRPFDAAADGVVFGDGAAVVVLERLADALQAGRRVLGVIRAIGLSSDGKSASINVPQPAGQGLAMRRAYAQSGLSIDTIQVIEAHATATAVGDVVEFRSLAEVFGARSPGLPRVQLGSVKALIGHTGWVSGVVSLVKMVQAFAHRTIPPQHNFTTPHPAFALLESPFEVSREARPWPANLAPYPRRAGINGFGFGGTNAHLVVEDFDQAYHRRLCRGLAAAQPRRVELAVVGVAGLFPTLDGTPGDAPSAAPRFRRPDLRLPAGKLLLPDVTEHMDASQYLTAMAAERILQGLPWQAMRDEIGVVLGLEGKTERGVRANERIFLDRLRRVVAESAAPDAAQRQAEEQVLVALTARLAARNCPSGPYTLPGLMPNLAASRVSSLFDLKGPNLVVDMGANSLFEALAVAARLLAHGDCRLVLAGGLNASGRAGRAEAEGMLMLALASAETARASALPVLASFSLKASRDEAPKTAAREDARRWRGAHGVTNVLAALACVREQGVAARVAERATDAAQRAFVFAPAAGAVPAAGARAAEPPAPAERAVPEAAPAPPARPDATPSATHAYVQGTPIDAYEPVLVASPPAAPAASLAGRRLLVLTDQPRFWAGVVESRALAGVAHRVVCPADAVVPGAVAVDLGSDESCLASVAALDQIDFDTIVAASSLAGRDARALLLGRPEDATRLLDLLFAVCRRAYGRLERGEVALSTLTLDAFRGGKPDPGTGLLGGFAKALSRELRAATVKSVHTDAADAHTGFRQLALELGQARAPAEVCWRGGQREVFALLQLGELAADSRPCLSAESVVLASGGARGVTAVLAEELLCRFGCTVVGAGRTDPGDAPGAFAAMDEAALLAYEARFYREELARDPKQRVPDLKRRWTGYQGVNELQRNLRHLKQLPGRFEYHIVDLQDEAAVARLVDDVYARYGRLDLVLHGAGVQNSKVLAKKSLGDFRRIVGTKLGGLGALYRACGRHATGRPVHFHLLSSAFSYLGNDGQPDYGAANEAMNRLAAAMDGVDAGAQWSSLAWLGWAGIGMTRGSEFAALAASRRLRGVTHDEGRAIFGRLMSGRPSASVNVLLAQGERAFYAPELAPPRDGRREPPQAERHRGHVGQASGGPAGARPGIGAARGDALVVPLEISLESAPYLRDHLVHRVPTLPGAFLIFMAAEAARRLRPERGIVAFENTTFRRFVRVYEGRPAQLRLDTRVVEEDGEASLVRVQVLSDFVHKSGAVLQKDAVQTEIFVRLAESPPGAPAPRRQAPLADGVQLPDPYLLEGSPVRLNGRFSSLRSLAVGGEARLAHYQLRAFPYPESPLQHLLPNVVLVDAFWRFGTIMATGARALSVYVPERCERMRVYFDYNDFDLDWLHEPMVFAGANPRAQGDQLLVGPIEAWDREGRLRLTVEGGVCRKFGEIRDAF